MGVRGIPIYCADYTCSHSVVMSAEPWPDDVAPCRIVRISLQKMRPARSIGSR